MHDKKTHYATLEIPVTATASEIKLAYRRLAMQWHPDRNSGNESIAEKAFKAINIAYEALSSAESKAIYDASLREVHTKSRPIKTRASDAEAFHNSDYEAAKRSAREAKKTFADGFAFYQQSSNNLTGFDGKRFLDETNKPEQETHCFEDPLQVSKNNWNPPSPIHGKDASINLEITVEQAIKGCEMQVDLFVDSACRDCNGFGIPNSKCPSCNGKNYINEKRALIVRVPGNVCEGMKIRIKGGGGKGGPNGNDGDFIGLINIRADTRFTINNLDIEMQHCVDFVTAILGGCITITSPRGPVELTLPQLTRAGKRFLVKEYGLHDLNQNKRGNLYIRIALDLPLNMNSEQLSPAEKAILIKWRNN